METKFRVGPAGYPTIQINKIIEMLLYGPKLRSGDLLGVHDWEVEVLSKTTLVPKLTRMLKGFTPHRHKEFEGISGARFWIKK